MLLKDKNITVVGLGKTGVGLINYLHKEGANIFVSVAKPLSELAEPLALLKNIPIKLETGAHTDFIYEGKDLVVISPGVDIEAPLFKEAASVVEVISEVELAYRQLGGKLIAVTGTKGKSTTTSLIYEIVKSAGIAAFIGGNIGNPLINEVDKVMPGGFLISEVSSFQLEAVRNFRPYIAVVTNITEDHLDRHKSMEKYIKLKSRIFQNQTKEDFLILNYDDEKTRGLAAYAKSDIYYFSKNTKPEKGAFFKDGAIYTVDSQGFVSEIIMTEKIKLKGMHNIENLLAACSIIPILNIKKEAAAKAIENFKPLSHRLEFVREVNGVKFYDDSKGTNPACVMSALRSFTEPVILIAGGRPKETDFSLMAKLITEKVRYFIAIGEAKDLLVEEVLKHKKIPVYKTDNFEEAVLYARDMANPGDVVLLSPACTSFDMFKNAEERGNKFKDIVNGL